MTDLKDRLQAALGTAYRLDKELGGGGMSRVFMAEDVKLGRTVVVKVLPPEMAAGVNVDRFHREIQLAAKLQHPHIVPLLTAGAEGDLLFYIMPHIEGQSLRARLAHDHELPVHDAVRILREVADALAHAHGHRIVHRDIKPDNILLSGRHALVTDFGVAKAVAESTGRNTLTSMGVALGTPAYMAPEQAAADPNTDHRADIYALGAVAYEMLTGRPPFTGPSPQAVLAAQVTLAPEPVTQHRESVPPALAAMVMRCLAKHPADRYQTAEELVQQLEQMLTPSGGMTPTGAEPVVSSGTAAAIRRGHPLRVAGLFGLAAIGVLAVVRFLTDRLGLPDWALAAAAGLLATGLPIMVWTGVIERRRALAHTTGRAAVPSGVQRWFTWRRALIAGGIAFGVLAVAAGGYAAMRVLGIGPAGTLVAQGALAERDRLVLAEFRNRTADSTLGSSVTEALRVDLAQSPVVRLLDGAAIAAALQRMARDPGTRLDAPLARELALRENAKAVVVGEISPVGRGYVLTASVLAAAEGRELVALRETADDDAAILAAVDRLSKRVRERIGESLRTIRSSEPLERAATRSLEALRKFSQAWRAEVEGDYSRAVRLLDEAVALDTTFGMAYRKLAAVLGNAGAARSRIVPAISRAYALRDRLPEVERYIATGQYYRTVESDPAKAYDAYRAALELDPDNNLALNYLSIIHNERREWAVAESLSLREIPLTAHWSPYLQAAIAQVAQGKFEGASATVERLAHDWPRSPTAVTLRANLQSATRRFDSAAVIMQGQARERDAVRQQAAALSLFRLSLVRGRLAEAAQHLRTAMAIAEQRQLPGTYLAAAAWLGEIDARFRMASDALRVMEAALARYPLGQVPAEDRPYLTLATFYARAGRLDRAKQLLAEYEAQVPEGVRRGQPSRHGVAADVALAEGRAQDAIVGYRAWYDQTNCATCGLYDLGRAYELAGQTDSALAAYERAIETPGLNRLVDEYRTLGATYKRLGELYEQRGERAKARDYYDRFVELWAGADPELQPLVRQVRERIQRLARER